MGPTVGPGRSVEERNSSGFRSLGCDPASFAVGSKDPSAFIFKGSMALVGHGMLSYTSFKTSKLSQKNTGPSRM